MTVSCYLADIPADASEKHLCNGSISFELWKEIFKLELSYVNKIKARRAIIPLDPIKEEKEDVEAEPNNMDDSMILFSNN
ncbi:hypothetical protein Glove_141g56 [Diversispora epigaea]|uniref:Uncharacterized protein n=1 Tax=Diversispora epigaea TaxID=1348612 RepID=A0A397J193_9GLOM|nr:hypothetical protein Glove_141g56 [Diversispora epigaea]